MHRTNNILIIDDEEGFLELLRQTLKERGFDVITASNAVSAGVMISSSLPALILMDINMPGINGLQACEAIRRNPNTKDVPIIIISALSSESDIRRAKKIGISEYFVKPVDLSKLIDKIKAILG